MNKDSRRKRIWCLSWRSNCVANPMRALGSRNDCNLTFSSLLLCREVWVGSIFIGVWFPASLSIDFSPLWKEGCPPGGFITGSAAELSHFIMAGFSFSFQKGDNAPVPGAPLANTVQLFLKLCCISALLCESQGRQQRTTGDQPETEQGFMHSSINRLPCSLPTPCLWGWFSSASLHSHQFSAMEKKTSSLC